MLLKFMKGGHDCKEFTVMNFVVPLCRVECFRNESGGFPFSFLSLRENSTESIFGSVCFYTEGVIIVRNDENRSCCNECLEFVKCFLAICSPFKRSVSSENMKWASDSCEVFDKTSIEIAESEEGLDITLALRSWPFQYTFYFDRVHSHFVFQ